MVSGRIGKLVLLRLLKISNYGSFSRIHLVLACPFSIGWRKLPQRPKPALGIVEEDPTKMTRILRGKINMTDEELVVRYVETGVINKREIGQLRRSDAVRRIEKAATSGEVPRGTIKVTIQVAADSLSPTS